MLTGDGAERAGIATRFANEIAQFAKASEPTWPAFNLGNRQTLEINAKMNVLSDPEGEIRSLFVN
jgi:carboxylesterase type B